MKRKNQDGVIVVEASIALSTFMFAIVMILAIVNICLVQAKVGSLIHGVAKEISNYSYLYSVTNLDEKEQQLATKTTRAKHDINTVLSSTDSVYSTIDAISDISFDQELWESFCSMVLEGAISKGKGVALQAVCRKTTEKRLDMSGEEANTYLKRLGIEDGISGLHFDDSEFCTGGGEEIKIVARYNVHVLKLLGIDYEFTFQQCAKTKAWCSLVTPTSAGKTEDTDEKDANNSNGNAGKESGDGESTMEKTEEEKKPEEKTEEEGTLEPKEEKTLQEYVKDATHNPNSSQVMLGKYMNSSDDNYVAQAKKYQMTYFNLSDEDWEALSEEGRNSVWEVNERFLQEQLTAGKDFYTSTNPYEATGYFYDEVDWLMNRGYTFEYIPSQGIWKAVKKNSN